MDEGNAAEVDRTADVIGSTRRDIEASAATEDAATSGNVTKRVGIVLGREERPPRPRPRLLEGQGPGREEEEETQEKK